MPIRSGYTFHRDYRMSGNLLQDIKRENRRMSMAIAIFWFTASERLEVSSVSHYFSVFEIGVIGFM